MTVHICTTQSLRAGVDIPPGKCPFCLQQTLYVDWVGSTCDTCRAGFYEDSAATVRNVREGMKLTRKEISQKAGLKHSTIKHYEWVHPSRRYWEWLKTFAAAHYAAQETK